MRLQAFVIGRGRRIRTLGTRFWRPLLYQLSYTPMLYDFRCIWFIISADVNAPYKARRRAFNG